jgi:hypothetical protein
MSNLAARDDDDAPAEESRLGVPKALTARSAVSWWIAGLAFWRRAPVRLAIVCLLPLVLEALIQLIPLLGTPVSKLVVPFMANGVLVVLHRLWMTGRFEWRGLWWSLHAQNRGPALQVALITAAIFILQIPCAIGVYGFSVIDAAVLGHMRDHPELLSHTFSLVLILPGALPSALLMFMAPLVVLEGERPIEAARSSVRLMVRSPAALGIFCLVSASLVAAALVWGYGLLLLVVIPWISLTGYAAYRSVFVESRAASGRNGAGRPFV